MVQDASMLALLVERSMGPDETWEVTDARIEGAVTPRGYPQAFQVVVCVAFQTPTFPKSQARGCRGRAVPAISEP